jgi:hypothetical protein
LKPGVTKTGYYIVILCKDSKKFPRKVHRLIAQAYLSDYSKDLQVDHIDRNRLKNSISNLRMVTNAQNAQNNNRNGCSYNKSRQHWQSFVHTNGKRTYLGSFNTEEEARAAYLAAKVIQNHTYTPENT